jgi:hypothetical protein
LSDPSLEDHILEGAIRVLDFAKVSELRSSPIRSDTTGGAAMPTFDELVFGLNGEMNKQRVRQMCREQNLFGEDESLTEEVFGKLGLVHSAEFGVLLRDHLKLFPAGLAASLMHILRFVCKEKNENIPLLFVWLGGYYRLDVQHSHTTEHTRGMVTVILHTPPAPPPRTA